MGRARRADAGVTLIEILVVIVIFSMLMGLGVSVLRNANKDLGVRAAAGRVVAMIRAAHDHARAENSPAWVIFTMQEPSAGALTKETVGMWHCEEDGRGAFGLDPKVTGAVIQPGRIGMGYRMRKPGDSVELGEIPFQAKDQGVALELWFWRDAGGQKSTIAAAGKDLELLLDATGRVTARIGGLNLGSGDALLPRESWIHVQLLHNGRQAKLFLNDVEVASVNGGVQWSDKPAPILVGGGRDGLVGMVDEIRLSLIVRRDIYRLPAQVEFQFAPGTVPVNDEVILAFDSLGRLDPARHPGPFSFKVKSPADEKEIVVTPQGAVRR